MKRYLIDDFIARRDLLELLEESPKCELKGNELTILSGEYEGTVFEIAEKYLQIIATRVRSNLNYVIVKDKKQYNKLLAHIAKSDYLAFDVESTGLNVRKDQVIGYGLCGKVGEAYYVPILEWNEQSETLEPLNYGFDYIQPLRKSHHLLTWNGSYDIRITKHDLGVDLIKDLHAEVMLMKHTVQEEGPFKLKDTGIELQEEIGLDVEKDANAEQLELHANVKSKGGTLTKAKYELYKGDLDLVAKYCCKDVDLTLRLFLYYEEKLKSEDLSDFFYKDEVMPLYTKVTIPMEDVGVKLDLDLMEKVDKEIQVDIAKYKRKVIEGLHKEENFMAWATERASKLYPPKKGGKFGQMVAEYYNLPLPKTKSGRYSLTAKNLEAIKDNYRDAYLFFTDDCPLDVEVENEICLELLKRDTNGDIISINSKQQLSELCFDFFLIEPKGKRGKNGFYSFKEETTDYIAEDYGYSWAKDLQIYNKLAIKIKPTYIDRFLENHEDGFFYFSYKQHGTISGRYGSDAQQIPRPMEEGEAPPVIIKYVNCLRQFFVARDGCVFIDADYESLEPHVFSDVSNEEAIRDIFRKGHDFYSTIAIATEGIDNVSADKKADNYLGKVDKPRRQAAKAYSLGIPYGLGGYALGKSLGISTEEGEDLVYKYLNAYPNLAKWMQDSELQATAIGQVSSKSGRVRHLTLTKELHKQYGSNLLDFKYRNKLKNKLKASMGKEEADKYVYGIYKDYKNGLDNSKNFQIQSLSASIVNRAMVRIVEELPYAKPIAQIHDQIVMEVPKELAEEAAKLIQNIMETVFPLSVNLKAPPEIATNLKDGH